MEQLQTIIEQQSCPDEEVRRRAVMSLLSYPLDRIKPLLFNAMGDPSWRVRKEAVETLSSAPGSEGLMEDLVGLLRAHDNAGLRNSAVEAIGRIGASAVPVLSRHLKDADQDVRKFIVDILGDIGSSESLPLLLEALEDPDKNVCAAAIENIGKLCDAAAIPDLVKCLAKPDLLLQFTALEALVAIGKPLPIARLLPLAKDNFLKKAVFDCLGIAGDAAAVPLLVKGLSENRAIREAAANALIKIRGMMPADQARDMIDVHLAKMKGSPAVDGLIASLATAAHPVRESIVNILGIIGDERAAACLLHESSDTRLSRQCLKAFISMGEAGAAFLTKAFPDAGDRERRFIAYACTELPTFDCTELLWQGMHDNDAVLRAICAKAAGRTGQTVLVDEIARLVDDEAPEVREASMQALSCLAESAHETLLKLAQSFAGSGLPEKRRDAAMLLAVLHDTDKLSMLIKDEDVTVRKAAVTAFAEVGSSAGISHLVMALVDEDVDVRMAAAGALGELGGGDVLDPLLLVLRDEDPWVRSEALKSLGKLGDERALEAVKNMVGAAEAPVVIAALETLMAINADYSAETLRKALDHGDEEVVKAAIELLSRMGNGWLAQYKEKLLHHPHWDVRRTFIRAIAIIWGKKALPELNAALETETDLLVKRQLAELVERMQ